MTPSARITGALLALLAATQAQAAPDPRPDAYNLLTHNTFFLTPCRSSSAGATRNAPG